MLSIVPAGSPTIGHFVTGKLESAEHILIGDPPVTTINVLVAIPVLKKYAERLGLGLADQGWVFIASSKTDKRANGGEYASESIWTLPGNGERSNGPATGTGDGMGIGIRINQVVALNFG